MDETFEQCQELAELCRMSEWTTGEEIRKDVENAVKELEVSLKKRAGALTYGISAMIGKTN